MVERHHERVHRLGVLRDEIEVALPQQPLVQLAEPDELDAPRLEVPVSCVAYRHQRGYGSTNTRTCY